MDLTYEIYINSKPEDIWNIFISPEGTKAIFFGCVLKSTFEVGAPYEYIGPGADGDETVHVYGEILAYEPYKMMSYTEHAGPSYRENHAELETRITLYLEEGGNCTKLKLVNDKWPENHPSYENTKSSWPMILSNVKTFAETGKTLDFGW
ncbi:SRPBCC family protein [Bacillus sp. OAE603]|uniref:SRPBCC family protein n=1 Tax=Gottfriedia sp. OAE603 TaxID=2663872 RepID=UPI00178C11FC